uniref:Uncharacterized protein n=1 Tax=Cannabis sativa TaxID=3483 RepID=A0A803QQX5_CANSA
MYSTFGLRMLVVLFIVFIITSAHGSDLKAVLPETTSFPRKLQAHQEDQGKVVMTSQQDSKQQVHHHKPCDAFSHEKSRSLCNHFHSNDFTSRGARPTPPPTPSGRFGSSTIDPRYGVEKRLVPSGPNPLHN